jgi:sulfite exporter TauE/SafE
MTTDIQLLSLTAASAGLIHTALGPDHYLPFVLIGKARKWSISKVVFITFICGMGHILSSVILGLIGVFLGLGVDKLNIIESFRGNIAAWALISFGLVYAVWGLRKALKNKQHSHSHFHEDGTYHKHKHKHINEHSHFHEDGSTKSLTPWVLFVIFVLGPCEVLIPLLMYPAAQQSISSMFVVTMVFGISTLITMISVVLTLSYGVSFVSTQRLGQYVHLIAGLMVFASGLAIQVLGV